MSKKTLTLIIGLFVVTIVLVAVALNSSKTSEQPQPQPTIATQVSPTPNMAHTTLTMTPDTITAAKGQPSTVSVMVNTGDNTITGVQLELQYDPAVLTNVKVTPGTFFDSSFALPGLSHVDTKTGNVTYALVVPNTAKAKKGTGTVATISFTPLASSAATETDLKLLPKSLVSQAGVDGSVLMNTDSMVHITLH